MARSAERARRQLPPSRRAALCLVIALTILQCAGAAELPQRFDATFALRAQGLEIGTTRWQLKPIDGNRFEYRSNSEAVGVAKLFRDERIAERSVWRHADGLVQPLRYSYSRSGGKRKREVEVRFDWKRKRVHNILNGDAWTTTISTGTQDKLGYMLALMQDLARGMEQTRYTVADGGKVKTYQLKVLRTETIDTMLGSLETVVVERTRKDDDRTTLVWCAPALSYLPVRVEHREADGILYLELERLEGLKPG